MKISKNYFYLGILSLSLISLLLSCNNDSSDDLLGNWVVRSDFEGDSRSDAVAFSIGNLGYVGTGLVDDDAVSDFWSYDPDMDDWTQIKDFEGTPRNAAVAFSAAGKGYVGTGYDGLTKLDDFWVYDPVANTWDAVDAPDGPSARYGAVAFSINDIGYVGTGYDGGNLKDFYSYDPATNTWTKRTSYQTKVRDAVAFVINNHGYICTGYGNEYENILYMYDPTSDSWIAKRKIANISDDSYDDDYTIVREKAVAFVMGTNAYIATGDIGSYKPDVWEYDATTDLWTEKTSFEGTTRKDAVAFTTEDGRGFVTTGISSTKEFDDLWEFKPFEEYDEDD